LINIQLIIYAVELGANKLTLALKGAPACSVSKAA